MARNVVQYIGADFDDIKSGGIYECNGVYEDEQLGVMLRIVDGDEFDTNWRNLPNWKPGFLYNPIAPGSADRSTVGQFEIIEDDENQSLAKAQEKARQLMLKHVG